MLATYFVMLGKTCNMRCVYCSQGQDCHSEPPIDAGCFDLVDALPSTGSYHLVFYGGEPLLYWEEVISIATRIKQRNPSVSFGFPTNGLLLTVEKAEILNALGFHVEISHDGYAYEKTRRHRDILKENPLPYLTLKDRGIAATISTLNPDYYGIWDYFEEFRELHKLPCRERTRIQMCRDVENNTDESLLIFKSATYEAMLDRVFSSAYTQFRSGNLGGFEWRYAAGKLEKYLATVRRGVASAWCGVDTDCCHVDLAGNLYACHNSAKPFGTVKESGFLPGLPSPFTKSETCQSCPVLPLCGGGCSVTAPHKHYQDCYHMYQEGLRVLSLVSKIEKEIRQCS